MKKLLIIVAVASMAMASCKKDRVCSCKTITSVTTGGVKVDTSVDQDYTMVKTGYRAAYYHCTHTKETNVYGSVTVDVDANCSLK